jgi:hypothetical protein
LEVVAAVLLGIAAAAAYTGPIHLQLPLGTLSVRTLSRPLLGAGAALLLRIWLTPTRPIAPVVLSTAARVVLGAVAVAGVCGWLVFRSAVCGGADSYGYVSAADRILAGRLIQEEPLAAVLPFADGVTAACPLGYVPAARVPNASVPAYPLGLSVLMAAGVALFGGGAPFWIAPLMGAMLLASAAVAARRWFGGDVPLVATALLAVQPVVFTYAIQPMSDVPAAAAVMLALALLAAVGSPWRYVAAGGAFGLALLIRPALAPTAILLAVVPAIAGASRPWRAGALYLLPVAAAIAVQAVMQNALYGSPTGSGYGGIAGLFAVETALVNVRSYLHWGWLALGPIWIGGVLVGLASSPRSARLAFLLVAAGVTLTYVFYRPYDHWETLRFLLPALVPATVFAAAGVVRVGQALAGAHASAIAAGVTVVAAATWTAWLASNRVFAMPEHESRHRLAGELVAQATPPDAVVLALQHSGSLRYYAKRRTINWDRIPPGELESTTRALQRRGHRVYLMIDSAAERAIFDAKHGRALDEGGWLPNGQRRNVQLFEAPPLAAPP